MHKNKPNLFIVGAPKCGTTSIYHYLNQSPDVFMSRDKEPHFLAFDEENMFESIFGDFNSYKTLRSNPRPVTKRRQYYKLFETDRDYKYVGEASTLYLYSKHAPEKIFKFYKDPSLRIIILLRNPVERAYSQFLHHVREDLESTNNFFEAFNNEENRLNRGPFWHYRKVGLYARQIKKYYELFGRNNVLMIKFEDFKNDPSEIKSKICSFLGLETIEETKLKKRYNATGYPVNKFVQRALLAISSIPFKEKIMQAAPEFALSVLREIRQKNLFKPELDTQKKNELMKFYHQDIDELESLTGISFSDWKG